MKRINRAQRPKGGNDATNTGAKRTPQDEALSYREKFDRWKVRFDNKDYHLPRRPWGELAIDYVRISAETGIPAGSLVKAPYNDELKIQAEKGLQRISTELFLPLTIGEVLYLGKRAFERRITADKSKDAKQRKAAKGNFASSCRRLETFAEDMAKPGLETVAEGIAAELATERPDSKTLSAWRFLEARVAEFATSGGLPPEFVDALDFVAHRTQWSIPCIAGIIGVEAPCVYNWLYKSIRPREHHEEGLAKLEANLGLPPGMLVSRIKRSRRYRLPKTNEVINPAGALPQGVLRPFLPPAFDKMSSSDQEAALVEAESFYRRGIDPKEAARIRMRRVQFILNDPHEMLETEIGEFLAFHSESELPYGMTRGVKELWKPGSVDMNRAAILRILGYCSSAECLDFRIPAEQLTLALFAFPQFSHNFVNWRIARAREALGTAKIPRTDLKPTSLGKLMVTPATGWLRQRGDLAARLMPVASKSRGWILSPAEIATAQANWSATCDTANDIYEAQYRSFKPAIDTSRDDHAKCLPILKSDKPQRAFSMLIKGLRREAAMLTPHCPAWQDVIRDLAFVHVEARCAFRELTLQSLTYRADNSGHVHKDADGHITIDAPADIFKNGETSSYFVNRDGSTNSFQRTLDHPLTPCNADIETYLREVRPAFADKNHQDTFLVMRHGGAMSDMDIDNIMRRITGAHLVWNDRTGTGFEGILRPLPLRFFRHVLCTGTWKLSGDVRSRPTRSPIVSRSRGCTTVATCPRIAGARSSIS